MRIGMVGGGKDAFIGGVHRIALRLDGNYELVAGSFSSNFDNSKETGKNLGLAEDRIYETYQEMAEIELKEKTKSIEILQSDLMREVPFNRSLSTHSSIPIEDTLSLQ